jgi:Rrf2 family iron-sulfur cluster assembly transcriptional regulator
MEETGYAEPYLTHELWIDLSQRIFDFLDEMTLADYTDQPEVQKTARKQDELYRWGWAMRRDAA